MTEINKKPKIIKLGYFLVIFIFIFIISYPIRVNIAQQRANKFVQNSNNYSKWYRDQDIELIKDWTGWNFHIPTSADIFGGCGSKYNYYHINGITFQISDRSYIDNGPC